MGEFIRVLIDREKCNDQNEVKAWVGVCPVEIFELKNKQPFVIEENEDECTLCELCLKACSTGAITIQKLYE